MYLKQKFLFISTILSTIFLTNVAFAENKTMPHPGGYTSHAMQKSMDPQAWSKMMAMMMDPSNYSSSMESCAECHEAEDVARYQQQFGPMMDAMFNMYKSMSPEQMMAMMGPMMGMMNPMMMSMMGPMMGMMNPMMMGSMMGPMMGMMNPMSMMGGMGGMNPMMGMMNPMNMMNPMGMMGGMNPMTQGTNGTAASNPMNMMGSMNGMMDPKQYEQWFEQMTKMMNDFSPKPETQK
jgi:cytochrome c553